MHLLVGNSLTRHDFHGKGHDTFVKIAPAHSKEHICMQCILKKNSNFTSYMRFHFNKQA